MTYVLDNIPDNLDRALRERAAAERKSPESIIVDLVASSLNVPAHPMRSKNAQSDHVARWKENHEFEAALREQNLIDWEAWNDGIQRRDLTGIAGQHLITSQMKEVFAEQRHIDPDLWK